MMKHWTGTLLLGLALATCAFGMGDDFRRERDGSSSAKDVLEGQAPPALAVGGWMNTGNKPLDLGALRGKVVILDFWGVW